MNRKKEAKKFKVKRVEPHLSVKDWEERGHRLGRAEPEPTSEPCSEEPRLSWGEAIGAAIGTAMAMGLWRAHSTRKAEAQPERAEVLQEAEARL